LKEFTRLTILLSLSVVLNIIESFIPLFSGIMPGFKLGLANIVTLFIVYEYGLKNALYVGILRVFLVGLLRTGLFNTHFIFSLSGCVLSIIMMFLAKKINLSIIGVSITGAIFHSIGQVLIAIILLNSSIIYYLPWLLLFSILTVIIIGLICKQLLNTYHQYLLDN